MARTKKTLQVRNGPRGEDFGLRLAGMARVNKALELRNRAPGGNGENK